MEGSYGKQNTQEIADIRGVKVAHKFELTTARTAAFSSPIELINCTKLRDLSVESRLG